MLDAKNCKVKKLVNEISSNFKLAAAVFYRHEIIPRDLTDSRDFQQNRKKTENIIFGIETQNIPN